MPVWCPKCNAMLPEGLGACPRCGASLGKAIDQTTNETELNRSDIFWLSAYTIGIVLIPLVIGLAIGLVCILLFVSR